MLCNVIYYFFGGMYIQFTYSQEYINLIKSIKIELYSRLKSTECRDGKHISKISNNNE